MKSAMVEEKPLILAVRDLSDKIGRLMGWESKLSSQDLISSFSNDTSKLPSNV